VNLEQLAAWLFARTSGGVRWGLERTGEMLAAVGDPHLRFRSLHIGGTNGKGSVASLCASALRSGGLRTGLYTSPHLVSFTERIQIGGQPLEPERILSAAERLRPAVERTGATFFEATTAIAFLCLADAGVEVAVVEVGMGGRLDATNLLHPEAAAVTNVALDHTEFLGDTLAEIAAEKAGIFKAGVPAITAERQPEALGVLAAEARRSGTSLTRLDEVATIDEVRTGVGGTITRFRSAAWGERELGVPLPGAFQARNAVLAAELLALLPAGLRPGWNDLRAGFATARWPGRLQVQRVRGTTFVFDIAHNPAGVAALCEALEQLDLPRPVVLLAGVLSDKEWSTMLPPLLRRTDAAILTIPPSAIPSRRWDPEAAADALQSQVRVPIRAVPDLGRALERAVTLAPHGTIVVTGSIHTVGDAMRGLDISPFGNLSPVPLSKIS
jgi:dihydrofolate synthase / folylpolyglutamate synthase